MCRVGSEMGENEKGAEKVMRGQEEEDKAGKIQKEV